jgi:hypothetical protein
MGRALCGCPYSPIVPEHFYLALVLDAKHEAHRERD